MNLIDVTKRLGTVEACNDFLESMRWPDGVRCLKCDSAKVTKYRKNESTRIRKNPKTGAEEVKPVPARILYFCVTCKFQFSVTTGTIFNDTHFGLQKWFMAVALMVNAKKGISALQMRRDLEEDGKKPAYKTVWFLCHRIRQAKNLFEQATAELLMGTIEADETYIGAKKYDKRRKRAKYEKEPVFGMIERDGKARTFHVSRINRHNVVGKLRDNIAITADAVYTDDSRLYDRMPENVQKHEIVNHSAKEWVRGDVHTGTIDGYWGLLKRAIIGSFHQVSIKHLHRYLSEAQFKWNHREAEEMFTLVIVALVIGSAMPYAKLIQSVDEVPDAGPEVELDGEPF
jgi:transposase-like protein